MKAHSSETLSVRKPRLDFPLFPHRQTNRWAKKVRGKRFYFGPITGDEKGQAALRRWLDQKDDLLAGRTPRVKTAGLTLAELCNKFLTTKRGDVDSGKLSPRTFVEYNRALLLLVKTLGRDRGVLDLRPEDFEQLYAKLTKNHGLTTLGREVTMVRSVFKYAVESDLIPHAIRFGPRFKSPSKTDRRKAKARQKHQHGAKLFNAEDIKAMLAIASPQVKAMLLLGINCGFGNTDCALLPLAALDLKTGIIDYPRPKTGIERRIPLWKETIEALTEVIAKRPKAKHKEDADLVFLTRLGQPWVRYALNESSGGNGKVEITGKADDAVAKEMRKLLNRLDIYRRGLSYYTLRHTFETIGGGCGDQVAVDCIMGHADDSMAAEYRENIEDSRLQRVVDHVHAWLFPANGGDQ